MGAVVACLYAYRDNVEDQRLAMWEEGELLEDVRAIGFAPSGRGRG
jgi:hypothetical protein